MNAFTPLPSHSAGPDDDLAEQARPGHGIPSQDPNPEAQVALKPAEAEREARSVMTGGGTVGGAAVGAAIGVAVAGPVGVVVGGTLGAVAGALAGAAAGGAMGADSSRSGEPEGADRALPHRGHDPVVPAPAGARRDALTF